MSYSTAVKLQYWAVGACSGFLVACLIAGAVFIHAGANMALNTLYAPQTANVSPSLDDVSLDNGLQGSSAQIQPAIGVK
jgi:hypothetical protein